jgi:putative ABC transport system permease protein
MSITGWLAPLRNNQWLMCLSHDFRFVRRSLARNRLFPIAVILIWGIGIGMNTFVFTIVNAELFKYLPFDRNGRFLYVLSANSLHNNEVQMVSYPDFRDWSAKTRSFQALAAFMPRNINLSDTLKPPEGCRAAAVTANSFSLVGERPLIGRAFTALDETAAAPAVVILSYELWSRRYGAEKSLIGQTIRINQVPATVIGVMPRGWVFPNDSDLWIALTPTASSEQRGLRNLVVFGLLAEHATRASARAEMEEISRNLAQTYPRTNQGMAPHIRTYREQYVGQPATPRMMSMLWMVVVVLLITCTNVASLILTRGLSRTHEISVRFALGGGRVRIVRLLLIESLILALIGGAIGWQFAFWSIRAFGSAASTLGKPRWIDLTLDYHVFAYVVAISIGAGVLSGLVPALRLSRPDIRGALNEGGYGTIASTRGGILSNLFGIMEVALALTLVVGAGLMIRGFLRSARAPLGVDTSNVLTMRLLLPHSKHSSPENQIHFYEQLESRLLSLPGVDSVAVASSLPLEGSKRFFYEVDGAPSIEAQHRPKLSAVVIDSDYFRVWHVGAQRGRILTDADGLSAPPVILVNQALARALWPEQDPIGKRLQLFEARERLTVGSTTGYSLSGDVPDVKPPTDEPGRWVTVVGVVPNIVQNDYSPRSVDQIAYLPFRQSPQDGVTVIARVASPTSALTDAFLQQVQAIDPNLPVTTVRTMEQRIYRSHFPERTLTVLFSLFSGFALLLAALGLYAMVAQSVSRRIPEIGVRMAVGATRQSVAANVLARAIPFVAIGLVIGLLCSWRFSLVLAKLLWELSPNDPAIVAGAVGALLLVAVFGCLIPLHRATSLNPVVALRHY